MEFLGIDSFPSSWTWLPGQWGLETGNLKIAYCTESLSLLIIVYFIKVGIFDPSVVITLSLFSVTVTLRMPHYLFNLETPWSMFCFLCFRLRSCIFFFCYCMLSIHRLIVILHLNSKGVLPYMWKYTRFRSHYMACTGIPQSNPSVHFETFKLEVLPGMLMIALC